MSQNYKHTGFSIALAWPQTYCKQPGSWYDPVTRLLGINRNHYYRAGHAALVLVDIQNTICHYFDFGRYHTPFKHGRVRSAETDHDLKMYTVPEISSDKKTIVNFHEILNELQNNPACHGEGTLYASYIGINFEASMNRALGLQNESPIPYGPFVRGGSNCSRFVNTAILSGKPDRYSRLRLMYFQPFTPTPLNNVNALSNLRKVPVSRNTAPFTPIRPLKRTELESTLPPPARHHAIPEHAQWLSGEGAGSWFSLEIEGVFLNLTRYSPQGMVECRGYFEGPIEELGKANVKPILGYLSHCRELTLRINGEKIKFKRKILNSRPETNLTGDLIKLSAESGL